MKMLCGYCGKEREYPNDFPVLHYAKCIDCYKKEEKKKKINWISRLLERMKCNLEKERREKMRGEINKSSVG